MDEEDSLDLHVRDTMVCGQGLCDEEVVRAVVADAPGVVRNLAQNGVVFDRRGDTYDLTREGGHRARRILHASDMTGQEIDRALRYRVLHTPTIRCLTDHVGVDLITTRKLGLSSENRCIGAYVLDSHSGKIETVRAKTTLLASGGAGKAYLYTTNPDVATGDGIAMAFRARATIANLEFFQFHPTCLYHPHAKNFLISETLRGEGGILRTEDGAALMDGVHPMKDLAPRDIVARTIDLELKRSGRNCVFLDMTQRDAVFLTNRFPGIHAYCVSLGLDMTKTQLPVVPAAHYCCGGVLTNLAGATTVPGLFAAGEVSYTGLHGANRLASNSLLEGVVFAERAAASMIALANEVDFTPVPSWDPGSAVSPDELVVVSHNWDELRRTMWNYVGIVRSDRRLERAKARIDMLKGEIEEYYWNFHLTRDLIELRNIAVVADLIVTAAHARRESRGSHYNTSTPETSNEWQHNSLLQLGARGSVVWSAGKIGEMPS
jgi:L-aspartate oxidase